MPNANETISASTVTHCLRGAGWHLVAVGVSDSNRWTIVDGKFRPVVGDVVIAQFNRGTQRRRDVIRRRTRSLTEHTAIGRRDPVRYQEPAAVARSQRIGIGLPTGLVIGLRRPCRALRVYMQCTSVVSGKGGVLEGLGVGGIVLVRDQLGVIAQGAATAAPALVTAAVPRDLRIDPREKKSKRDEISRVGQRSVDDRKRGSRRHSRSTFYSGNAAAKFAKICGFQ